MNPIALLKLLGAVLKGLPLLSKFASVAKWFTWIPGGQIIGILGSIAGLVLSFFKWLLVDITDALKEPQRLLVRTVCILGALVAGFYWGVDHSKYLVEAARRDTAAWQTAYKQSLIDSKAVDAADKDKHQKAMAARVKAEADERAKIEAEKRNPTPYIKVVPVKPVPTETVKPADTAAKPDDSVQPKPARKASHCKGGSGQSGVSGLQPIWGGGLSCKSI